MSGVRIMQLPTAGSMGDSDVLPVVQGAGPRVTRRTTFGALKEATTVAAAAATSTLTWDRISLRTWMEGQGYVWGSGADAAPLINTLLAQTVQGGPMSGRAIVCPPGLLPCMSPLRIPDFARRVALIGDGNFRLEKRFGAQALLTNGASSADTMPSAQRPSEVYISGIEVGTPYTPDPAAPNFALGTIPYNESLIRLNANAVRLSDLRLWGIGSGSRFLGACGADWICDSLDLRYGVRTTGVDGIRIPWCDGDMTFRRCVVWSGDDALQPVQNGVLGLSHTGVITFEDCFGRSSNARGACVVAVGNGERIATQATSIYRVIYRRCRLQGAQMDAIVNVVGTTGSIDEVWFDDCEFLGPDASLLLANTGEFADGGSRANLWISLMRHRGQPSYGALRSLRVTGCRFYNPGKVGIQSVRPIGIGVRKTAGVVSPTGTLEYYSGQDPATLPKDVTIAPDVAAQPIAEEVVVENTMIGQPGAWRPLGLEADGTTPRSRVGSSLATSVSGTTDITLGLPDIWLYNRGTGQPIRGMRVLFVPLGDATGPITLKVNPADAARPVYLADRVTQAGPGDWQINASGFAGVVFESLTDITADAIWRVMTAEEITADLVPGIADPALLDLTNFRRAVVRGGERHPAPGQTSVLLSGGDGDASTGGQHIVSGGAEIGLDVAPLYGDGPGSPAAWAPLATPSTVSGVLAQGGVRSLLVTGGHRTTPAQGSPATQIAPYRVNAPAVTVTRGVRALLLQSAMLDAWPAVYTYAAGAGWTVGDSVQYPAGWTGGGVSDNRVQTFTSVSVVDGALTWDIAKSLLRQDGGTAITLTTITPSSSPGVATQVTIAAVNTGVITLTNGGNLVGLIGGNPLILLQGNSATFEWDPISSLFRLVASSVPYSSLGIQNFTAGSVSAGVLAWDTTKQMLRMTGSSPVSIHTLSPTVLPHLPAPVLPRRLTLINSNTAIITLTSAGNITGLSPRGQELLLPGQSAELEWDPTSAVMRLVGRSPWTAAPTAHPGYNAAARYALVSGPVADLAVGAADLLYVTLVALERDISISELEMLVKVAGAAGAAAKVAIWQAVQPGVLPSTRPNGVPIVAYNTGLACDVMGTRVAPIATTTLAAGPIWLGALYSSPGALPTVRGPSPNSGALAARLGAGASAALWPSDPAAQMTGLSTPLPYSTDLAAYNPAGAVWTPVMSGGGPPALVAKAS